MRGLLIKEIIKYIFIDCFKGANVMNTNLLNIVKQIIAQHGESILTNPSQLKSYISDLARNEPKEDRVAFGRAIEQGFYMELKNANPGQYMHVKTSLIKRLQSVTGYDTVRCTEAMNLLEALIAYNASTSGKIQEFSNTKLKISKRTWLFAIAAFAGAFSGSFFFIQSGMRNDSSIHVLSDVIWSGFAGLGIAVGLFIVQTIYLKKKFILSSLIKYAFIGFITGSVGWLLGVIILRILRPIFNLYDRVYIVICWMIFGLGLGFGASFYVPNYPKRRAMLAGLIGGLTGGLISHFLLSSNVVGVWLGDSFVGFTIGLMISLVEESLREAWITVYWGPKEARTIALGIKPILFGSSREADIYIPQRNGQAKPVLASISIENGSVLYEDKSTNQRRFMKNGEEINVDKLKVVINTKT